MDQSIQMAPTIGTLLLRSVWQYGDRTAFSWEGGSLSYRAMGDLLGRMQAVYASAGLIRSHRVCLLTGNSAFGWCAGMAALCSGMISTPLHPLGSLEDHLLQIQDFNADVLVVDVSTHRARGEEILAAAPGLRSVFSLGQSDFGSDLLAQAEKAGSCSPRDLTHREDVPYVHYTGGSTGRAKGVVRDHAAFTAMLLNGLADFEIPAVPRYLAVAPITHVTGTKIMPTLVRGGTVHLQDGFAPDRVLDVIRRERINMALMVPTMIYSLLDNPSLDKADLSSLELLLYGASPMSAARLHEGLERIGPVFAQLYGQTEAYPLAYLRRGDHDPANPERFASCGRPTLGTLLKVLDDQDQEVPLGEAGEICVRGIHVMREYLNLPELSDSALNNGWLHTGDIGRFDDRGYLYIVDRKKDMVISGGFNVYPRDVEDIISTHPAVSMVAVIGVPDPKWGEAVAALVVCRPGEQVRAEELVQLVKSRKGAIYAPKQIEFVERLPLTSVGKIDKKALRMRFWEEQGRQVS